MRTHGEGVGRKRMRGVLFLCVIAACPRCLLPSPPWMGQAEIAIKTAIEQDEITRGRNEPGRTDRTGTSRDTTSRAERWNREPRRNDKPGGDRAGRQAGRDGRSDELMRTARDETNCHLPGIRPYQGVVGAVSFLVSPHRLVFRLVPCLLACRLRFISSSHPVSRYRLVLSVSFYPSRWASRAFPVPSSLVACSHHDRNGNRGDATTRRAGR